VKLAPAWRALQVGLGMLLFLWSLGWLRPLHMQLGPYALLAGLMLAGAMWVTEALVGLLAQALGPKPEENANVNDHPDMNSKGPRT
jgi:hypothetical protein